MNIICVSWGNKYSDYVAKLKKQIENNCSIKYNFYCLTDNPSKEYDILLPDFWDEYYNPEKKFFWAYRKCYMFNENLFPFEGDEFLYLDLDVLIHQDLSYFKNLEMSKPYIVRGWWKNSDNLYKQYGKLDSTLFNSSVIRWNRGQLKPIYEHIDKHKKVIFFTYKTIDNYFYHFFYKLGEENRCLFNVFPKNDVYSWYKGNIFNVDMEVKKLRTERKICLFNNSTSHEEEHMNEIKELKELW